MVSPASGRFGLFACVPILRWTSEGTLREIEYAFDVSKPTASAFTTSYEGQWPGEPDVPAGVRGVEPAQDDRLFHPLAPNCCAGMLIRGAPGIVAGEYPGFDTAERAAVDQPLVNTARSWRNMK